MSACKLGTVPVHRLTREQCDKMIKRCNGIIRMSELRGCFNNYDYILNRIQQYKQNLDKRGL